MEINVCDIEVGDILEGIVANTHVEVLTLPEFHKDEQFPEDSRWVVKAKLVKLPEVYRLELGTVVPNYTVSVKRDYLGKAYNVRLVKKNNEIRIPQHIKPFSL